MTGSPWAVHKFGGSSVADADCFRRVAAILDRQSTNRLGVVLSACKGVTDALLALVTQAERQDSGFHSGLDAIRERHARIAGELLSVELAARYLESFDRERHDIEGILQAVRLTRSAGRHITDLISGYGEIWSTRLFRDFYESRKETAVHRPGAVRWLDAREVVVVEWGPLGPFVKWDESRRRLSSLVSPDFVGTLVITGFIATDVNGVQTTLGRNGSDFSASIFGSLLDAAEIHIWTDVDGVLSADPRRVPDAQVIDSLSYNEAMELAYFGAKVIHPQTMAPAVGREIPIWIRNTFAPDHPATLICARPQSALAVKGITTIENIALLNLEGAGMIGVPGTASRLFGALREEGISVVLISQGSSEHSICCAVPRDQADRAVATVRAAFSTELNDGQIQSVEVDRELAILAVVGDGMACRIPVTRLRERLGHEPASALTLLAHWQGALDDVDRVIAAFGCGSARARLARYILFLLEALGEQARLRRQEAAELIGVTPVSVTRLIGEFKRDGLVREEGLRLQGCDRQRLSALAANARMPGARPPRRL